MAVSLLERCGLLNLQKVHWKPVIVADAADRNRSGCDGFSQDNPNPRNVKLNHRRTRREVENGLAPILPKVKCAALSNRTEPCVVSTAERSGDG